MQTFIPTPPGFSFGETMRAHGWRSLLPFTWHEDTQTLERIERLDNGRVVRLLLRAADDGLHIDTDADARDEAFIVAIVRRMLQLGLPMEAFHAFCDAHPALGHVAGRGQGRLLVSPTLWEDGVKVICTTNTTWTQTKSMVARIVNACGSGWPADPARRAFPSPAQVAAVPLPEFAEAAKLGYRAPAVYSLARSIAGGSLDLETLCDPALSTPDVWKQLLALRGVGPYAASCLLIYMGRYGRVNVDSWARSLVGKELGRAATDADVHAFFAPFGEWQALAYHFYPWAADGV